MSKLQMPQIEPNMGLMDRVIRGAIGGALLMHFMDREAEHKVSLRAKFGGVIGGAFLIYGLTGWDPLLNVFDTNTLPDDDQNVARKTQQMAGKTKEMIQAKASEIDPKATLKTVQTTVKNKMGELAGTIGKKD